MFASTGTYAFMDLFSTGFRNAALRPVPRGFEKVDSINLVELQVQLPNVQLL